jgi:hypothetical protein
MTVAAIRAWCDLAITELSNSINAEFSAWSILEHTSDNLAAAAGNMEEAQGMSMAAASQTYSMESARVATELDSGNRAMPAILNGITSLEHGYTALMNAGMESSEPLLNAGVDIARANEYYGNASGAMVLAITHMESVPNLAHGIVHETINYAAQNMSTVYADLTAGMNSTRGAIEHIQAYIATL